MLTGYNQDVYVGEDVIHVQTEDKGREKALVETLVYRGGTIIAAKRTSYADQLAGGELSDIVLGDAMRKQHQIIVAIVKAGKVEEFVRAARRANERDRAVIDGPAEPKQAVVPADEPLPAQAVQAAPQPPVGEPPSASADEVVADGPDEVVDPVMEQIPQALAGEIDLDRIISDYLHSGRKKERLRLRMLGRADFLAGDTIVLQVQATRGTGQPIEDASVVVKVIGTAFRPQIFPGRTDHEGIASFNLTLPTFTAGSAAIVVQASSKVGDGEIKHLIRRR
jgi:hypothetical protein